MKNKLICKSAKHKRERFTVRDQVVLDAKSLTL